MKFSYTSFFASSLCFSQLVDCSPFIDFKSRDFNIRKFVKQPTIKRLEYSEFQISDGLAGNCSKNAERVFLTPYNLTQVTVLNTESPNPIGPIDGIPIEKNDLSVCKKMTRAAIDAKESFTTAIDQSGGPKTELGKEFQNGKVLNFLVYYHFIYLERKT
ncbi:hypothetical protein PTTG_05070 [Puccinia triticina 1-1 BBBD Race 1]|uniref:Uncharacterized protein n=1 Tax=Puccinia triticina (isolate 1-1 / race 1 (BBBD)) TaxID=630390 RepID=A0A0C4EW80_PUCT1|nr:hypothetical protein PTTG_05070 [Puccinia triticina 1-1 BBBD Race 1]WAR63789.1 hypothetical protein PtB15_17B390 [Puccinia triticina]